FRSLRRDAREPVMARTLQSFTGGGVGFEGSGSLGEFDTCAGRGTVKSGIGNPDSRTQYFGTLGSTSSDQAVIPPFRLTKRPVKPALFNASIAFALRTPPLQCTTVSTESSISFMRITT